MSGIRTGLHVPKKIRLDKDGKSIPYVGPMPVGGMLDRQEKSSEKALMKALKEKVK